MCAILISGQPLSKRGISCRIDLQRSRGRTRSQAARIELTIRILLSLPPFWRRRGSTPDTCLWSTKEESSQAFQLLISQRCAVVHRSQIRLRGILRVCRLRRGHLDASRVISGPVKFAAEFICWYQTPWKWWWKILRYCVCDPYAPKQRPAWCVRPRNCASLRFATLRSLSYIMPVSMYINASL